MQILVVDDDRPAALSSAWIFEQAGYSVRRVCSAAASIQALEEHQLSLLVVDMTRLQVDGRELYRQIRRRSDLPLLVISHPSPFEGQPATLEYIADAYLLHPYQPEALLAAAERALQRRQGSLLWPSDAMSLYGFGLDPIAQRVVCPDGRRCVLTPIEFRLLCYFLQNSERTLTPVQILNHVWGYAAGAESNLVAVYVRRLRRKIERNPQQPVWIRTVRSLGYRFEACHAP